VAGKGGKSKKDLAAAFLDTGRFTGTSALIENAGATDFPAFVYLNFVQGGHVDGEDPLYSHVTGNFPNGEGLGGSTAPALQHYAPEELDPFFVAFFNLVVNGDGVARFEIWDIVFFYVLILNVLY
jgi:hypothetical protein